MRVSAKGQVTIPNEIRKKLHIVPGSEVDFILEEDGRVYIAKVDNDPLVRRFSTLRGMATMRMSTEEIMTLTRMKV